MQELIEKIIKKLEEKIKNEEQKAIKADIDETIYLKTALNAMADRYRYAIEIVKQAAEQYTSTEHINCSSDSSTNGWIPCSERLPEEKGDYLVTCDDGKVHVWWFVVEGNFKVWEKGLYTLKPIAWKPLPEPYQTNGELEA